ncbi:MAG: extracellular solute-binding protein [Candidatus Magasanikbacteria bacterium]|nr:extracellular solute-binding protein [Candidatus Magasanikbacteria bacterium]
MFKKFIFLLILVFLLTSGFGCRGLSQAEIEATKPITLNYWRVFDDSDSLGEIIAAYQALHPNITINYRKLRSEEFQTELLNALAEDRGPDMFTIQNTWLRAYQSKINPLPSVLKIAFQKIEGKYQKKVTVDIKNIATPSVKDVQDRYVAAVADNVAIPAFDETKNQYARLIYGLPFSVDALALYYNKDLLDQAGIAEPPRVWADFQKDVIALTKVDQDNNVARAGAALGLGKNVTRAVDILSLLMMQNGVVMSNDAGFPTFNQTPAGFSGSLPPAEQALQFYTDFAQPTKQVYCWNAKMPESFDAFVRGQSAFFLGYSYHLPFIRARAPKLNFNIAPVPQINPEVPVNFASFWVETVSKKTPHPQEAWDFILFAASAQNVVKYLDKTQKPTALRELIAIQKTNADLGVFAGELLTAKSWYKGKDAALAEKYFSEMIDSIFSEEALNDPEVYQKAINSAAAKIGQTM